MTRCEAMTKHGTTCESSALLLYELDGQQLRLCRKHAKKFRNAKAISMPSGSAMGKKNRIALIGAAARRMKMRSCR